MKILILCTGNSCRSQMAEGFLKSFADDLEVSSGGTKPEKNVSNEAIEVMKELNIDISKNKPNHVNDFINENWDYVITVCSGAKEICPIFLGNVKNRLHIGFEDPFYTKGTKTERLNQFRIIRDKIKTDFFEFFKKH